MDIKEVKEIEIAFDGCDQVDSDLDAYKSGGGGIADRCLPWTGKSKSPVSICGNRNRIGIKGRRERATGDNRR